MTYKEAKDDILLYCEEECRCHDDEMCKECSAYLALMAIELQIPKKATRENSWQPWKCECGNAVMGDSNYCKKCGQAIDWSEDYDG